MTHELPEPTSPEEALRAAGLRVTAPRLATLEVVGKNPHADAETITAKVREKLGSVSTQAVYDVLNALTDVELVRRVAVKGRSALFELHEHDNHHHLVCRECGRLENVQCQAGPAPCLDVAPGDDFGFLIDEAEVIYRGYCPQCREEK